MNDLYDSNAEDSRLSYHALNKINKSDIILHNARKIKYYLSGRTKHGAKKARIQGY